MKGADYFSICPFWKVQILEFYGLRKVLFSRILKEPNNVTKKLIQFPKITTLIGGSTVTKELCYVHLVASKNLKSKHFLNSCNGFIAYKLNILI